MSIASTVAITRSLDVWQLVSAFVLIPKLHKLVFTFVNAIYDYLICVYDVFIIVFSPHIKKIHKNCDAYQAAWLSSVLSLWIMDFFGTTERSSRAQTLSKSQR